MLLVRNKRESGQIGQNEVIVIDRMLMKAVELRGGGGWIKQVVQNKGNYLHLES